MNPSQYFVPRHHCVTGRFWTQQAQPSSPWMQWMLSCCCQNPSSPEHPRGWKIPSALDTLSPSLLTVTTVTTQDKGSQHLLKTECVLPKQSFSLMLFHGASAVQSLSPHHCCHRWLSQSHTSRMCKCQDTHTLLASSTPTLVFAFHKPTNWLLDWT